MFFSKPLSFPTYLSLALLVLSQLTPPTMAQHPTTNKLKKIDTPAPPVFDTLHFGDSTDTVLKKLAKSKMLLSKLEENEYGRSDINGAFITKMKLNQLPLSLHFIWKEKKLTKLLLRSPAVADPSSLEKSYKDATHLLNSKYGRFIQKGTPTNPSNMETDTYDFTVEWETPQGYAYLGMGKTSEGCVLIISFDEQRKTP